MEAPTLHRLVEQLAEQARGMLLRDGSHTPMLLLFGKEKSALAALDLSLGTPGEERLAIIRGVGSTLAESYGQELGPLVFVLSIHEAWGREVAPGETLAYTHLENDPKREELLAVTGYEPVTDTTEMRAFEMRRDLDGKLVAVEPHHLTEEWAVKAYLLEAFCEGYTDTLAKQV